MITGAKRASKGRHIDLIILFDNVDMVCGGEMDLSLNARTISRRTSASNEPLY